MITWLKLLPLEIDAVDELMEPQEVIKEGERVAGTISSDELKKLYSLWKMTEKAAELLLVELKYGNPSEDDMGKIVEMKTKARVLQMLFWIAVNDEFSTWSHQEMLAMRLGWQLVEYKVEPPSFFQQFFKG